VSDTGPGIAAEDLPHVRSRFWRGGDRTAVPGSGIGLAVASQLVQAHHGRLSIESPPGKGTTVVVDLPRRQP
jgi:signal transduction histidine kinase